MPMGWFSRLSGSSEPEVSGQGIILRRPAPEHFRQWSDLREESRAFLSPWEPRWADDRLRLRVQRRAVDEGTAQPFFIFDASGETMVGGINITNIRRGVAQTGTIGYWIGKPHAGKGHMTAALAALQAFARDDLRLHRLEAACLPRNGPSIRLLESAAFEREGFAKAYLRINGAWEDHVLWGKLLNL
jgi:[ribosomal protein S5]-alanine N-acetyltransferase